MRGGAIIWRVASFAVAAGFIALWQAIASWKLVSPVFLPGPDRAWTSLVRGFSSGDLWSKLFGTLEHMAYGWLAASIAGIALGAMIGSSRLMRTYVAPSLEFLRPLPVSAIIPVAIAAFGLTQAMALFVIAFGAIWPIMLATIHGFAAVEPRLYEVARSLQMSRLAVIFKIALPSASPDILAGMRLSLTVALILAVVCEILAGLDGLGHWVLLSARAFRSADLFAGVILLGATGYVTSVAMSLAEQRLLAWQHISRTCRRDDCQSTARHRPDHQGAAPHDQRGRAGRVGHREHGRARSRPRRQGLTEREIRSREMPIGAVRAAFSFEQISEATPRTPSVHGERTESGFSHSSRD